MDNIVLEQKTRAQGSLSSQEEILLHQALSALKAGEHDVAEQELSRIIQISTNVGETYHHIGITLLQNNYVEQAKSYLFRACELMPNACDSFFQLGICYYHLGDIENAIEYYRRTLAFESKHAKALAYLALSLYEKNDLDSAEHATVNWIHAYPGLAVAYNLLGSIYLKRQQYQEAIPQFNQAIQLDVMCYEAIANLGQIYVHLHQYQQADQYLRRALTIQNRSSELYTYYGINALNQCKYKQSQHCLQKALTLDKKNAFAYANLSVALQHRYCFGSGNAAMRKALMCNNQEASFYVQFAGNLLLQNHPHKAIKSTQRALQLMPSHPTAKTVLSEALLSIGDYEQVWGSHVAKAQLGSMVSTYSYPFWEGQPFPGKVLLVHWQSTTEETLLWLRYIPLLKQYGRRVVVACPLECVPILKRFDIVERVWVSGTDLRKISAIDLQIELRFLPLLFNTTLESIPDQFPYLHVSDNLSQTWTDILEHYPQGKKRVGLAWMSAILPNPAQDVAFAVFASMVKYLDSMTVFNLTPYQNQFQYERGNKLNLHDIGTRDIGVLAAIIMQLDVIITGDNLVAHIAGALNKPVCLLLPFAAKWYWITNDKHIPLWYPSVRLFRQTVPNQWHDVISKALSYFKTEWMNA